jgi:Glycosyl transferase family 21
LNSACAQKTPERAPGETTKSHLAAIHGFEAMLNDHSDDFELGNQMAARGLRIELTNPPLQMMYPRSSMRELFQHESQPSQLSPFGVILRAADTQP